MKSRKRVWTSRVAKLLVAGIFLLWFVPFAHERITTPPARAPDDYSDLIAYYSRPQQGDATQEWIAALARLPAIPVFDEPPPARMQWEFQTEGAPPPTLFDPVDALSGDWSPASRPTLRVWIRFIGSGQTSAALQRITALRDRPWLWDISLIAGGSADVPPGADYRAVRQAAKFFVGRSRFQREQRGDLSGAWEDLKTALVIRRSARPDTLVAVLVNVACEAFALDELGQMAREVELTVEVARDVQQTLQSLPSLETAWTEAMRGGIPRKLHLTAGLYTDDGHGSGWLVLGGQPDSSTWLAGSRAGPSTRSRSRLWNLFSPLYNDRRTVQAKVVAFHEAPACVAKLDYRDAVECLEALDAQRVYEPADGPYLELLGSFGGNGTRLYQVLTRTVAKRRAAQLMVALNRFRIERGAYPQTLDELVPEFIDALPPDPYCAGPFAYRLDLEDGYVLYSCGPDGDDDGGPANQPLTRPYGTWDDGDDIYTVPRSPPPVPEPVAVPVTAPARREPDAQDAGP